MGEIMIIGDIFINKKSESLAEITQIPPKNGCAVCYETNGSSMVTSKKQFLEAWSFTGNNALLKKHDNSKSMIIGDSK